MLACDYCAILLQKDLAPRQALVDTFTECVDFSGQ